MRHPAKIHTSYIYCIVNDNHYRLREVLFRTIAVVYRSKSTPQLSTLHAQLREYMLSMINKKTCPLAGEIN